MHGQMKTEVCADSSGVSDNNKRLVATFRWTGKPAHARAELAFSYRPARLTERAHDRAPQDLAVENDSIDTS